LPQLRTLYQLRVRFKAIFDTEQSRRDADRALTELFLDATAAFPELESCVRTYERWQDSILAYFDARQTSAAVEGINNKARVITKRCYGIKSAATLWQRLILDLNRAGTIVSHTIQSIRALVHGLKAAFS
jgi:transposase